MMINVGVNVKNCRCECDKGFIWNPGICECERDKSCDVGEYLDYKNCKCRKKLLDKLVEDCAENIDEVKIASENEHKCSSSTLHIVLFSIIFAINIRIGAYVVYYKYMNRDNETASRYDYVHQITI